MSYKRYIKKGNKVYGPYTYKSERVNGKVQSSYIGQEKPGSEDFKFLRFMLVLIFGLLFFLLVFLSVNSPLTGRTISSVNQIHLNEDGNLNGILSLSLAYNEALPVNSTLIVASGNSTSEFNLSDIISEPTSQGSYYM
jgi:hypothetical protein